MNLQGEKNMTLEGVPDGVNDVEIILQLSKNMILCFAGDVSEKSQYLSDLGKISDKNASHKHFSKFICHTLQ